ncbi:MAG: NepR family anti-sigma factor [Pseudomonadota bacterium]
MANDNAEEKAPEQMQEVLPRGGKRSKPEWADGLRQLYDNVLDEPLPDSFADLLSKLDDAGQ